MEITTADKLIEFMNTLTSNNDYYFRGYKIKEELLPSGWREKWKGVDKFEMFKSFNLELLNKGYSNLTFLKSMELAQHFGIPTNLIDLTIDYNIALFFGLGRKNNGNFHILYAKKDKFEEIHSHILKPYETSLKLLDIFQFDIIDKLTLKQMDALTENSQIDKNYLNSLLFRYQYEGFLKMQNDFILLSYEKDLNVRKERQKGLFFLSANNKIHLPIEWFSKIDVKLESSECEKLKQHLSNNGYTDEYLFPSMINNIDVKQVADNVIRQYKEK